MKCQKISEDTQEMLQLWSTAFPRHHKLERWGTRWPQWLSLMCLWLVIRRSQVWSLPGPVTFFFLDWTWNHFYSHSLPSVESRRQLSVSGKRICLFTRESIQKTNIAKCSNTCNVWPVCWAFKMSTSVVNSLFCYNDSRSVVSFWQKTVHKYWLTA